MLGLTVPSYRRLRDLSILTCLVYRYMGTRLRKLDLLVQSLYLVSSRGHRGTRYSFKHPVLQQARKTDSSPGCVWNRDAF